MVFLRRSLVAAALVVSLLSVLVPLAASSSVHLCTMECCAGKAPHEAGACSSGLMKGRSRVAQHPEVLCGLHQHGAAGYPTTTRQVRWQMIVAGTEAENSGSCGPHTGPIDKAASHERTTAKSPGSSSVAAPSMTSPCAVDCTVTGSAGYVRQPRPREQAAIGGARQPRPPSRSRCLQSFSSQTNTLPGHYRQPQPRGPPLS